MLPKYLFTTSTVHLSKGDIPINKKLTTQLLPQSAPKMAKKISYRDRV